MISMDFVECLIQWFISKSKMIPICIIFILFHILKVFIFPVDIKHARFCRIKIANKLQNTIYVGYMINNISAGADGGPRFRVFARLTLCSAPINTSGYFCARFRGRLFHAI